MATTKKGLSIFILTILLFLNANSFWQDDNFIDLWNTMVQKSSQVKSWKAIFQLFENNKKPKNIKTTLSLEEKIDLSDPKNKWLSFEQIKKIYKYSKPIDEIKLYELDEWYKKRHDRIFKRLSKYDNNDLVWMEVVFPNHINPKEIEEYTKKYSIIEFWSFFYSWIDMSAYFWFDYEIKSIRKELETWEFRREMIEDLIYSLEYYEKDKNGEFDNKDRITYKDIYEWKELEEKLRKYELKTQEERERLFQVYHRGVIVKAMTVGMKKKDAIWFLEETWAMLKKAYNSSYKIALRESMEKKNSQSSMRWNTETIHSNIWFWDIDGSLNQFSWKSTLRNTTSYLDTKNLPK